MYVIAHHRIVDPTAFSTRAAEPMPGRPPQWRLITSAPTRDGAHCFSLWRVDSPDSLQRFLAGALGGVGTVECYEVDDDNAMGLMEMPVTVIRVAGHGCSCGDDFLLRPRAAP